MFKKLLKLAIVLGVFAGLVYAADDVYIVGGTSAVTGNWKSVVFDSFTTHVDTGRTIIRFSAPVYNLMVTSLNAATDSGYITVEIKDVVKLPYYVDGGGHHTTSPYTTYTIGDNSEADTLKLYMAVRELWINCYKGGTADSSTTIKLWGAHK